MKIRSAFFLQVASATIPAFILLLVIPIIRNRVNIRTFADFTVIVSVIGFLSVFDGGLGRTTTYFVSKAISNDKRSQGHEAVLGAIFIGFWLAVMMMMFGFVIQGNLSHGSLLARYSSIYILLAFCPLFIITSILKGAIEGEQRFALSTFLQLIHGIVISIAPAFVITNSSDLILYVYLIGIARFILMASYLYASGIVVFSSWPIICSISHYSKYLFQYSKWLFFSNIIGLCIVFADRFAITGFFNENIVAAYVMPMELIARGQILISAFCGVMFPKIVSNVQSLTDGDLAPIIIDAQGVVVSGNIAIGFFCLPWMSSVMEWWLGHTLASQATTIALIGMVGLALLSISSISMLAINGMGHTRQVAILHTTEIFLYILMLYVAVEHKSLYILLFAWLLRLCIDALGMAFILYSLNIKLSISNIKKDYNFLGIWIMTIILFIMFLLFIVIKPLIIWNTLLYVSIVGLFLSISIFIVFIYRLRNLISASLT